MQNNNTASSKELVTPIEKIPYSSLRTNVDQDGEWKTRKITLMGVVRSFVSQLRPGKFESFFFVCDEFWNLSFGHLNSH